MRSERSLLFAFILLFQSHAFGVMCGSSVKADDWFAQVSVKITSRNNPKGPTDCSGTRIAPRFVLTAAHCASSSRYGVFSNGANVRVKKVYRHPRWNNNTDAFDFAILEFDDSAPAGPVAGLPEQGERLQRGAAITIAGSGYTHRGGDGRLHIAQHRLANPSYTATEMSTIGERVAGCGRTGMCGGDSGGGNFDEKRRLVGISSSTAGEDRYGCHRQGYLANVATVRTWIDKITSSSPQLARQSAARRATAGVR